MFELLPAGAGEMNEPCQVVAAGHADVVAILRSIRDVKVAQCIELRIDSVGGVERRGSAASVAEVFGPREAGVGRNCVFGGTTCNSRCEWSRQTWHRVVALCSHTCVSRQVNHAQCKSVQISPADKDCKLNWGLKFL